MDSCLPRSGYTLKFNVYTGKGSEKTVFIWKGLRCFFGLLNKFLNLGHIINFTSTDFIYHFNFFQILFISGTGAVRRIMTDRRDYPDFFTNDIPFHYLRKRSFPMVQEREYCFHFPKGSEQC